MKTAINARAIRSLNEHSHEWESHKEPHRPGKKPASLYPSVYAERKPLRWQIVIVGSCLDFLLQFLHKATENNASFHYSGIIFRTMHYYSPYSHNAAIHFPLKIVLETRGRCCKLDVGAQKRRKSDANLSQLLSSALSFKKLTRDCERGVQYGDKETAIWFFSLTWRKKQ